MVDWNEIDHHPATRARDFIVEHGDGVVELVSIHQIPEPASIPIEGQVRILSDVESQKCLENILQRIPFGLALGADKPGRPLVGCRRQNCAHLAHGDIWIELLQHLHQRKRVRD